MAGSGSSYTPSSAPPAGLMPASVPYDVQTPRGMPGGPGSASASASGSAPGVGGVSSFHEARDIPRAMGIGMVGMGMRELPRPEMPVGMQNQGQGQSLPPPHALQLGLGPPDVFRARMNSAGERVFMGGPGPGSGPGSGSDRFSPEGTRDSLASAGAGAGGREREIGSGAGYSDLRNSSTPGEPR